MRYFKCISMQSNYMYILMFMRFAYTLICEYVKSSIKKVAGPFDYGQRHP